MTGSGLRKRLDFNFAPVPHATCDDEDLSYRALGVLTKILRLPDGWDIRSDALAKSPKRGGREGRDAVRSALRELAAKGYYRLERRHTRAGTFEMGTAVSNTPIPEWAAQCEEFDGRPIPMVEQEDGTYLVKHQDGTLSEDGFAPPPSPPPDSPEADEELANELAHDNATGAGKPGPGEPGPGTPGPENPAPGVRAGKPAPGNPASGEPGPFSRSKRVEKEPLTTSVGRGGAGGNAAADAAGADASTKSLNGEILPGSPSEPPSDAVPPGSASAAADADVITLGTGKLAYHLNGKQAGWPRRTKRGVRLTDPDDFVVTSVMRKWAQQECPQVDLEGETRRFVRYWIAKSGAGGTKLDWGGTWQNWFEGARDGVGSRRSSRRPQPAKQTADDTLGLVGGAW
jgi:hypothetical protein